MKKFLLGTVGLVALSSLAASLLAAPASAADLAARPYTKAPPPMIAAIYDWSGFYIGLNGGGGWGPECVDISNVARVARVPASPAGRNNTSRGRSFGHRGQSWRAASWR